MTTRAAAETANLSPCPAFAGRPVLVEDRDRLKLYVTLAWPEPADGRIRFTGWALQARDEAYALDDALPILRDLPARAVEIREPEPGRFLPLTDLATSYAGERDGRPAEVRR